MNPNNTYDPQRMKALVRFVLDRGVNPAELGNALWLAEARNFVAHGQPIAGASYRRTEAGIKAPVAGTLTAESRLPAADDESRSLDPSLSAGERESAEWALLHLHDPGAAASWARAQIGEEVPFHALLALQMRQPKLEELEWAKQRTGEPAAQ